LRDRLRDPRPRRVLQAHAADSVRARDDLHRARRLPPQNPFGFQLLVRLRHDLRIGQQLLRERPVLGQLGPGPQRARGHMLHELANDLFVNRHRRFALQVDHYGLDANPGAGKMQRFRRGLALLRSS